MSKRVLERIEKSCEAGEYYDAQQMYKSIFHKQLKKKEYQQATHLLLTAIRTMFKHKQVALATELALCLIELYTKANWKLTDHPFTSGDAAQLTTLGIHCF